MEDELPFPPFDWSAQQIHNRRIGIEVAVETILGCLKENPKRDGLKETPSRVANALMEMTEGYEQDPEEVFKTFEVGTQVDSMVIVSDIPFHSMCEHHMLPFHGHADIGYIPGDKVLGLSKFCRLVDIYAHRLQVQERLNQQILDAIVSHLQPLGAIVVMRAEHMCMEARGVRKSGTLTTTSCLSGVFRDKPEVRQEFLALRGQR